MYKKVYLPSKEEKASAEFTFIKRVCYIYDGFVKKLENARGEMGAGTQERAHNFGYLPQL